MMEFTIPVRTISALNAREHWRRRAARVRKERETTGWVLGNKERPALPCVVTMKRMGPSNGLDSDNLVSSMKGIRDAIAKWLGVDDKTPQVEWRCAQERCMQGWSVIVTMETAP